MPWHVAKSSECPTSKPWACIKDSDGTIQGCHETEESAQKQMAALYANEPRATSNHDRPVENRSVGQVAEVHVLQRLVDLVVVPWEQEADVWWRDAPWREKFLRGSFDGIETRAGSVRANREHQIGRTVGKAVNFDPKSTDGLVGRVKIAKTVEGDDVLSLAAEDMVSISGGFVMRPSDVDLNKRTMLRTVKRAFLDHISFVEQPAYEGAKVLAVREGLQAQASGTGPLVTPKLDEFMDDELIRWANSRRG